MNQPVTRFFASVATFALALAAQAHPGHDLHDASARHLFTSADHLAVLALAGAALWFGARSVQDRLPRRVLQGIGVLAIGVAGLVWGLRA